MKALTILQPYASLVAIEAKTIETRSWPTKYRGPLAIHAGKRYLETDDANISKAIFEALSVVPRGITYPSILPFGAVIAIACLVGCYEIKTIGRKPIDQGGERWAMLENDIYVHGDECNFGYYHPGRFAWILENVRAIAPIEAKGKQGLWNWDGVVA